MNIKLPSSLMAAVFATFVILLAAWGCTKEVGVIPPPPPPPPPGACDTISYTTHIKPIVDTKCVSCHRTGLASNNWNFETYEQLKKASDDGILRDVLLGQNGRPFMPYGTTGLPKEELDLIFCWIDNGELK